VLEFAKDDQQSRPIEAQVRPPVVELLLKANKVIGFDPEFIMRN